MMKVANYPLTMSSRLISTYPHHVKEFGNVQSPYIEQGISHVTLIGRVGSDPVHHESEFGTYGIVILAVNTRSGNQIDGYKQETIWFRIRIKKVWDLKSMTRTRKGDRVFVQGHLLPINPKYVKENMAPTMTVSAERYIIVHKKLEVGHEPEEEEGHEPEEEEELDHL